MQPPPPAEGVQPGAGDVQMGRGQRWAAGQQGELRGALRTRLLGPAVSTWSCISQELLKARLMLRVSAQTRPVPGGRHRPPEGESRGGRGTSRLSSGSRGHLACLPPQGHREPPSHAHPLQLRPPCLPGAPRGRVPSGMTTGPSARAGSCRALNPVSGREEQVLRRTWVRFSLG